MVSIFPHQELMLVVKFVFNILLSNPVYNVTLT